VLEKIKNKLKTTPKHVWILIGIILVGIFLRTYNFHDWLDFRLDQVRDATLVGEVVEGKAPWPDFGPTMRKSGTAKDALFRIGPAYYYMQIFSAKIFGNEPAKMAYPDLFFSILSIPLFYVFLNKYFQRKNAMVLTTIYSFSYFSVLYSRFAWNPNSIPFFVILFLLALYEFLSGEGKTHRGWIAAAGMALGIGIQLHAILFVLLPVVAFLTFVFLMKKNRQTWKKWAVVFLIALALNLGQFVSEIKSGFANTKILLNTPVNSASDGESLLVKVENAISCHFEANGYILSSAGQDTCARWYSKIMQGERITKLHKGPGFWAGIGFSFLFSIFGYVLLLFRLVREKEKKKKYFLGLIGTFLALSFLVMVPIISSGFLEFRYLIHTFFAPFILLGLWLEFIAAKNNKVYPVSVALVLAFLLLTNGIALRSKAAELSSGNGSDDNSVFLGEAGSVVNYLSANSGNSKTAYFSGEGVYVKNFFQPFSYLAKKQNFDLVQAQDLDKLPTDGAVFYIRGKSDRIANEIRGYSVEDYKKFGQVVIYKLK